MRTSLGTQFHLPLSRLVLCLDCEQCFELGTSVCPACGSETWTPLARFLASLRDGYSVSVEAPQAA